MRGVPHLIEADLGGDGYRWCRVTDWVLFCRWMEAWS